MARLQVLIFPDQRLRTKAQAVAEVTDEIRRTLDDMLETMYDEEGIGLAATQVDIHQQMIVLDVSESRDQPVFLINPEILDQQGEQGIEEGCLSVPGVRALVPRAAQITVRALDRDGQQRTFEAENLLAICIQHEIDHLQGKLFIDYLSPLKRQRLEKKLLKLAREQKRN